MMTTRKLLRGALVALSLALGARAAWIALFSPEDLQWAIFFMALAIWAELSVIGLGFEIELHQRNNDRESHASSIGSRA